MYPLDELLFEAEADINIGDADGKAAGELCASHARRGPVSGALFRRALEVVDEKVDIAIT